MNLCFVRFLISDGIEHTVALEDLQVVYHNALRLNLRLVMEIEDVSVLIYQLVTH